MVGILINHNQTDYLELVMDNATEDLDKLPTQTSPGKEALSTIKKACMGSTCYEISTGNIYILHGNTNTWELM